MYDSARSNSTETRHQSRARVWRLRSIENALKRVSAARKVLARGTQSFSKSFSESQTGITDRETFTGVFDSETEDALFHASRKDFTKKNVKNDPLQT